MNSTAWAKKALGRRETAGVCWLPVVYPIVYKGVSVCYKCRGGTGQGNKNPGVIIGVTAERGLSRGQ